MVTEVTKRLITVEDYYKMAEVGILKPTDRVELIQGDIYEMSPIGSKHASVVNRLSKILNELFGQETIISIQAPVRLDNKNEPEPDVAILKFKSDFYASAHPGPADTLAIIEVSDSTINFDRSVKTPLYAVSNILVYWIVDIETDQIIVHTNPVGKEYLNRTSYRPSDNVQLLSKTLKVSDIIPPL
ncbi:MAG: Uma2 family endonuclease [Cyclobacteriaceae bacterium]